ncbi:MAG: hypothetical protein FJ167_13985, partial [Gammaproteobacteria bacterium]|nr:hypothetical protein [Gammaproteobacteria bacterium]
MAGLPQRTHHASIITKSAPRPKPRGTKIPPRGFEPSANLSQNLNNSQQGGAKCGALDSESRPIDPELAELVAAWPTLPEPIRAGILAMVRAASG